MASLVTEGLSALLKKYYRNGISSSFFSGGRNTGVGLMGFLLFHYWAQEGH
jgi:Na+/proline symporter